MSKLIKRNKPLVKKLTGLALYRAGAEGFKQWCEDCVCIPIYPDGSEVAVWCPIHSLPDTIHPETGRSYRQMWEAQCEMVREAFTMVNGKLVYNLIVFCWPRGEGKCQKKGSKVLLYNGSVKKVEDVVVGDLLMGDDNTPRKVLSLVNGVDEMFEVIPRKGETLTVNGDHILSLKRRCSRHSKRGKIVYDKAAGEVVDISLKEFQKKNKWFRDLHLQYKVPVDWPYQEVPIDPYFLGLWLGDGSSHAPHITTMDHEVVSYIKTFAKKLGLQVSVSRKPDNKAATYKIVRKNAFQENVLTSLLKECNLLQNKHIPQVYKANSREVRMQILAGIIDSDGYLNRNSFQVTLVRKGLAEDLAFIARSLGFHVEVKECQKGIRSIGFVGTYYRVGISGDCSLIPTRVARRKASKRNSPKDVLVSGIKEVRSVGMGEYYGFTLSGNGRYLTSEFTVTHNSFLACLIQMWKFFNWPKQSIMLGANSKDQVKFVHFDIIADIIRHSPRLLAVIGMKNILEKEIRIVDGYGNVVSMIRSISSFSGIVSNITGFTFSEVFEMKNPRFYAQLYGSIRNVPNALGVIDSTVSDKAHFLYKLYRTFLEGQIKHKPTKHFFHYRYTKGHAIEFTHPHMTQAQLDGYENTFMPGDFEKYFLNTWDAARRKLFPYEYVEACYIYDAKPGVEQLVSFTEDELDKLEELGILEKDASILQLLSKKAELRRMYEQQQSPDGVPYDLENLALEMNKIDNLFVPMKTVYKIPNTKNSLASVDSLERLSELYGTQFSVHVGLDRSDPTKINLEQGARTIITICAKGLPTCHNGVPVVRSDKQIEDSQRYMYFLLGCIHIPSAELVEIKECLQDVYDTYDGFDTFCSERWGAFDLAPWFEERDIEYEFLSPHYNLQKSIFTELYFLVRTFRLKMPPVPTQGSKGPDILKEELSFFDHDDVAKWYGSPEKNERYGIQDDALFSLGHCIYGGRMTTSDKFRSRKGIAFFGAMYENKNLLTPYRS